MEQNLSNVCVATIHKSDQHKSSRLPPDDVMPLYASIIPENTRKARLQQQQQLKLQQHQSHQSSSDYVSVGKKSEKQKSDINYVDVDDVIDNENDYSDESDAESADQVWSNEIPVYIKGEQRWISGITDETTCFDLIEALLIDEGIVKAPNEANNNGVNLYPTKVNEYVIIERWRRMEQALDGRTKILKIWTAWGAEQSEVKFTLKRRSDSHHSASATNQSLAFSLLGDRDSGRGSPTGSINSAIVRRRRHRASRSTFAWMTHGQTIHPKSSVNNIERLMKLILNQGEIIQQQLAKLRDRELEISNMEEARHKLREKEHGKNYVLETYLKGLTNSSSDEKQELAAGNSDSGVHTEETGAASPEVHHHEDEISETLIPINEQKPSVVTSKKSRERRSKREHELLMEHQSTKEYTLKNAMKKFDEAAAVDDEKITENENDDDGKPINKEVAAQIDILERLIVLNKHLQREEELCVRLSAKIKRYEADASGLSETQVKESLKRVNEQLDVKNYEIGKMENEIKSSDEALSEKTEMLKKLYDDLEEAEVEHRKLETTNLESSSVPIKSEQVLTMRNDEDLGMSREYLAENIYNISKIILKSSGPSMPMNMNNINTIPENSMSMLTPANQRVIQAQIHSIPQTSSDQFRLAAQYQKQNDPMSASMNYLATINQRIQKNNPIETDINNAKNPLIPQQYKLAPKKLLINAQTMSNVNCVGGGGGSKSALIESRSNTFKRSVSFQPNDNCIKPNLTQDVSQLGTLV